MKYKPIFFILILLCVSFAYTNFFSQNIYCESSPSEIKVIADKANVYASPLETSTIIQSVFLGQKFEVENIDGEFYKIKLTSTQSGYVKTAYCMDSSFCPLLKNLDTNAVVTQTSFVYIKVGDEFQIVNQITLNNGDRVKLLSGAEVLDTYSLISFTFNEENLTYYILTENLNADGVPLRTLVAIMLIITCSALFLIIFSFYKQVNSKK